MTSKPATNTSDPSTPTTPPSSENRPRLTILRGLPGVGKSTFVSRIAKEWNGGNGGLRVFSADHFFTDPKTGKYSFDPQKASDAHGWCLREFVEFVLPIGRFFHAHAERAAKAGTPAAPPRLPGDDPTHPAPRLHVIVDNTNLRAAEIAPYYAVGKAYGFWAEIITLRYNYEKALERQVHGVTRETYAKMSRILHDEVLPPWWHHMEIDMGPDPSNPGQDRVVVASVAPMADK